MTTTDIPGMAPGHALRALRAQLRHLRHDAALSALDAAIKLGINVRTVLQAEQGAAVPDQDDIVNMLNTYDASPATRLRVHALADRARDKR